MRKYTIIASAAALAAGIALSGCGGDDGGNETPAQGTPDATTTAPAEETPGTTAEETPGAVAEIGETINFAGTGETTQIDCESGKSLNVALNDNNLTVVGLCHDLRVGGTNNTITLDHVENSIYVAGADNQVTYRAGDPQVDTFGDSNQVTKG